MWFAGSARWGEEGSELGGFGGGFVGAAEEDLASAAGGGVVVVGSVVLEEEEEEEEVGGCGVGCEERLGYVCGVCVNDALCDGFMHGG